ncbi:Outer membrane protein assembly factor YaeT precursor [Moritella sp. JT01]|uniref:porin family protein n=1 Tax=Moritella sp. JT01 TaxID=756698 RepID=UPI00079715E5|nr:porin family protein [Moritella sp. JT01]KXO07999.1 Outer membrane protein assembly factor YaeT precursor [Moritella sp. JT01]
MKSITVLGALTALALTASVQANQDVSGFYIGGGVGSTEARLEQNSNSVSPSTDGTTFKVIGGYQFNRIVAIEAQYTKYGKVGKVDTWEPKSFSVAANLGYTFENGLRPFGIIGLSSLDLDQNVVIIEDTGSAVRLGAGLEYTPAALSGVSFRGGYEGDLFIIDNGYAASDTNVLIGSVYVAATYKF